MKFKLKAIFLQLTMIFLLGACDTFRDNTSDDSYSEVSKQLDGTWQLKTVLRNGNDISNTMNFSQFHMVLNKDSSYILENYLPFVVSEGGGTWSVDDPYYPFLLTFRNEKGENAQVEISYPIVEGKRNIILTLSPGCYSNSYEYSFEKVDND